LLDFFLVPLVHQQVQHHLPPPVLHRLLVMGQMSHALQAQLLAVTKALVAHPLAVTKALLAQLLAVTKVLLALLLLHFGPLCALSMLIVLYALFRLLCGIFILFIVFFFCTLLTCTRYTLTINNNDTIIVQVL
jgi:hypothetical protein